MRNGTGLGARRAWGQSSCVASGRSLYLSKPQFPRNTYLQRGCEDLSSKDSREVGFFNPAQMQVAGGLEGSTCSPPEAIRLGDRGAGLLPRPVQLHSPASPPPTLPLGPPATASEALRPGLVVGEGGAGAGAGGNDEANLTLWSPAGRRWTGGPQTPLSIAQGGPTSADLHQGAGLSFGLTEGSELKV